MPNFAKIFCEVKRFFIQELNFEHQFVRQLQPLVIQYERFLQMSNF